MRVIDRSLISITDICCTPYTRAAAIILIYLVGVENAVEDGQPKHWRGCAYA